MENNSETASLTKRWRSRNRKRFSDRARHTCGWRSHRAIYRSTCGYGGSGRRDFLWATR